MKAAELFPCTFCNKTDEKLLLFTEKTLKKCQETLKQRIIHNFKYKDVILPDSLSESGYHSRCYRKFTALQKRYYLDEIEKNAVSGNKNISSNNENKSVLLMDQSVLETKIEMSQNDNITSTSVGDINTKSTDDDYKLDINDVCITTTSSQAPLSTIPKSFQCTFCNKNDKKVMKFTENTFQKSRAVLKQRKIYNLKYSDVVLPDSLFERGYHRHCYGKFTALQKKYHLDEIEKLAVSGNENLPSNYENKSVLQMDQSDPETKFEISQNDNIISATAGDINGTDDDDKLEQVR